MPQIGRNSPIAAPLFLLLSLCSLPSLALQPVEEFLAGARKRNPDDLEARANLAQQQAQADSTLAACCLASPLAGPTSATSTDRRST